MNHSSEPQPPQTLRRRVWFEQVGQRKIAVHEPPDSTQSKPQPRPPRLTVLMALVIRYDQLLRSGHIRDFVELSRMCEVSRARMTQIMNLRLLAPDIQEAILFLPLTAAPIDPISERDLRPVVAEPSWEKQRALWKALIDVRL